MEEAAQAEAKRRSLHQPQQAPTPLSFQSIKRYSVRFAPVNLYVSALNWLMPERVTGKGKEKHAYPIGGEYVVEVDHCLNYLPRSHRTVEEGEGCPVAQWQLGGCSPAALSSDR